MGSGLHVLVTGGAGYIGSILTEQLLLKGYAVTVLDRFQNKENTLGHLCAQPMLRIINGDVRNEKTVAAALKDADVVIPLAAMVGAPICSADEIAATSINRDAVQLIARLLSPAQRLIFPNSNSGYGIGQPGVPCDENSPLNPLSLYGRTKVDAEKAVLDFGGISLRLATVFGMSPRMRIDLLVNDLTYRALYDRAVILFEADFKRNYIHVRDVARAFLLCLERYDAMKGKPYNLGLSSANLSKRELCEAIRRHVPGFVFLDAPIGEDPDKRNYIVSNARIEAAGFTAQHSLDDGIKELITGYQMLRNTRYGNV